MGHMGELKAEYRELQERLDRGPVGYPRPEDEQALKGWRELLEILYTPEEAALGARMPMRPTKLATLATRFGTDPETLRGELDRLADKGLVMDIVSPRSGEARYLLAPPVVGFFEFAMMRAHDMFDKARVAEAMDAYLHGDATFATEVFGQETVIGRAMVHEDGLAGDVPEVLDWERASRLIDEATSLGVSLCYCRHKAEHLGRACDAPQEICLSMNGGAEFLVRRGFGRPIERQQAHEILARARELGLVQIADNVRDVPSYLCNCCACCCGQLSAINEFGLRAVNPSGFDPVHDDARCSGCSRCSRACPITAISMVAVRQDNRRKNTLAPSMDLETCIGCGVCASACPKDAIAMERNDRPRHVPLNTIERVVRTMLEKGRLADLLFDQGQSRGTAFLNQALSVLTGLPPAERLLASEQVRSRFVRHALSKTGAPRG